MTSSLLDRLGRQCRENIRRFPLTLVIALLGTTTAITLMEIADKANDTWLSLLGRLFVTCLLGIGLTLLVALVAEFNAWSSKKRRLFEMLALALLSIFFLSLNIQNDEPSMDIVIRSALLFIAVHLGVAALPGYKTASSNGFWQYNRLLFLRLLFSLFFSGILYVGLILALLGSDRLLGFKFPETIYFEIYIVVVGLVNTWIFLSGLPMDWKSLNDNNDYPHGLKIFSQYLFVPLVSLYFLILYLYAGKLAIIQEWPQGWISVLMIGLSISGLLAFLLVYPLEERFGSEWIKKFVKWFFAALIPLLGLEFMAIYLRVSEYGFTEPRVILFALTVWLSGIAIYFLSARRRDIRIIPLTLLIVTVVLAVGPLSAVNISRTHQMQQLETILIRNDILQDRKMRRVEAAVVPKEDRKRIYEILDYLCEKHDLVLFKKWLTPERFAEIRKTSSISNKPQKLLAESMGLPYSGRHDRDGSITFFLNAKDGPRRVDGYEMMDSFHLSTKEKDNSIFKSESPAFELILKQEGILQLKRGSEPLEEISISKDILALTQKIPISEQIRIKPELLRFDFPSQRMRLYLKRLDGSLENGDFRIDIAAGILLFND